MTEGATIPEYGQYVTVEKTSFEKAKDEFNALHRIINREFLKEMFPTLCKLFGDKQ